MNKIAIKGLGIVSPSGMDKRKLKPMRVAAIKKEPLMYLFLVVMGAVLTLTPGIGNAQEEVQEQAGAAANFTQLNLEIQSIEVAESTMKCADQDCTEDNIRKMLAESIILQEGETFLPSADEQLVAYLTLTNNEKVTCYMNERAAFLVYPDGKFQLVANVSKLLSIGNE